MTRPQWPRPAIPPALARTAAPVERSSSGVLVIVALVLFLLGQ
jgi:hypothetical protein